MPLPTWTRHPCIYAKLEALICTKSWNQQESSLSSGCVESVWTKQDLLSSLTGSSSWAACCSTSFSLPCINPQALNCKISWNQLNSHPTCVWTKQYLLSSLKGRDLLFTASSYGMGKEGQKAQASRAEVRRSFITTTVWDESQVTPQGRHR